MSRHHVGPAWKQLLSASGTKNFQQAVETLVNVCHDATILDTSVLVTSIASALQAGEPRQILVGCIAVLAVLDLKLQPVDLITLSDDSIFSGLSAALSNGSAIVVAAAVRSLCALTTAALPAGANKEDKLSLGGAGQAAASRPRKVVQQLRTAMEKHATELLVQEAFTRGCCTLLATEQPSMGSHANALWMALWPLAVHPREEVAQAAVLSLCRLTWLAKSDKREGSGSADSQALPDAEAAISMACDDFGKVFDLVESSLGIDQESPHTIAQMQCTRLLGLLQSLILCGCSPLPQVGRARTTSVDVEDAITILPVSKLVNLLDTIFSAILRSSISMSKLLDSVKLGSDHGSSIGSLFVAALRLAAALIDIAGAAVLPNVPRLRKWIELFTEISLPIYQRHCWHISGLFLAAARSAPSILLNTKLLKRVVAQLGNNFQSAVDGAELPTECTPGLKRKREEASLEDHCHVVQTTCLILTQMLNLGAPLVPPPQIGSLCEQLIKLLWLGVMAPRSEHSRVGKYRKRGAISSGSSATRCQALCQDSSTALALLDLVAALHQPARLGATSMASSVVDAFVALISALACFHQRCIPKDMLGQAVEDKLFRSVRLRAMEVKDSLLCYSGRSAQNASHVRTDAVVSISWLEPSPETSEEVVQDRTLELRNTATLQHLSEVLSSSKAGAAPSPPESTSVREELQKSASPAVPPAAVFDHQELRGDAPKGFSSTSLQGSGSSVVAESDHVHGSSGSTIAPVDSENLPASSGTASGTAPSHVSGSSNEPVDCQNMASSSGALSAKAPIGSDNQPSSSGPLELFPDDVDDVSVPELCMDSSDSENPLG